MGMKCLICYSKAEPFFSKQYLEKPFDTFMADIGEVNYFKCSNCGFTFSKTHLNLTRELWEKLNYDYHQYIEGIERENPKARLINQPPYLQQALMIKVLSDAGIIDSSDMLDFAGGYGTLRNILLKYFNISLRIYDPFIQSDELGIYLEKDQLKKFRVVINSAIFEHIRERETLEAINACVADNGCMILHTVVCENIPKDPNWFYLKPPVHCAFHTNKSMEILMEQWNYKTSIYCATSKCWVLLKEESEEILKKIESINLEFQCDYLVFKKGFVDYWKGF